MSGTLFIVATPIGNLEDITLRASRVLAEVDLVVCEDTRVSSKLLKAYNLSKKTVSVHEHSLDKQIQNVIDELKQGQNIAYVSDAGTPGVNDPGGKLAAVAQNKGLKIVPIPGPSSLTAAISICGFPMDEFVYLGFAPHKKGRETFFKQIAAIESSVIFFESTHRIAKALESLKTVLAETRLVCVGRELTKMHETIYRGPIAKVAAQIQDTSLKGEFVIIIGPQKYHD